MGEAVPCSKPADIITVTVGADIIRPVFLKAPLVKGGGFGFAKTGGILLKLPDEFNGMGLQSLRHRLRDATSLYTREAFVNGGSKPPPYIKTVGVIMITVGADIIRPFF